MAKRKLVANDYSIGESMKVIREWSGMTQEEFAKEFNTTKNTLSKRENDKRQIYFHTVLDYCNKTGVKIIFEKEDK